MVRPELRIDLRRAASALRGGSVAIGLALLCLGPAPLAQAASHSDAPLIKQDPQANITDVYAFIGTRYDDPGEKVLNVMVHVRPFSEPGDGVIYDRFADDALYSIHIADPTSGQTAIRYDFQFSDASPTTGPGLKNPDSIFSYGTGLATGVGPILDDDDVRRNYTQTYSVSRAQQGSQGVIGSGLLTPPPNVGLRTTPLYNDSSTGRAISGATSFAELDVYTQQAISDLSDGSVSFAGPREDGFYADTPAIFDLLDGRILDNDGDPGDGLGQDGGGVDGFKGFNVLAYGLQIPVDQLSGVPGAPRIGVWASVSRPRITIRSATRRPLIAGQWIQVNRMGNPLFNEALVGLADKDAYNRSSPVADSNFLRYALDPELARLLNLVFGTSFVETGRGDLASIFIPDVLRVYTDTPAVPLPGQVGFNRLSFFGGDEVSRAGGGPVPGGWPNGRRLGDDVIDIALTALASGPSYSTITIVGDNVSANDQIYHQVFPYSATPHAGSTVDLRQAP